jgi:hypothetical protein
MMAHAATQRMSRERQIIDSRKLMNGTASGSLSKK